MLKKTKFKATTKVSQSALRKRINYMSDVTHDNHVGKTILAARNYRCEDHSGDAFETKALQIFQKYREGREGKEGKRTSKLFEEFIYSSAPGSFLTAKERVLIEHAIMVEGFQQTTCRTVWHEDPKTGRSDLHVLAAGFTDDIPPRVHLSFGFGHGERDFLLTLERAEREALDIINRKREPDKRILSAREKKKINMREAKVKSLAETLAGVWDGSKETLTDALEKLGYIITKFSEKNVSVVSHGKWKPKRYNIDTLRENVEDVQIKKREVIRQEREAEEQSIREEVLAEDEYDKEVKLEELLQKFPEKTQEERERMMQAWWAGGEKELISEDNGKITILSNDPMPAPKEQKKVKEWKPRKPNKDEPPPI